MSTPTTDYSVRSNQSVRTDHSVRTDQHRLPAVDNTPPTRSKITGGLATLACAACCAIPLLIAAGLVTGAGAAILQKTLLAVAAGLAVLALGMWWLHRRRQVAKAKAAGESGCDDNCDC